MLTMQGPRLEQALIEGGVNPLAANTAMATVANCSQPLTHRGPVSADYTPPDFNFITPELRKYRFPNLETVSGEMPRIRPPKEEKYPTEDRIPLPPETENQSVRPNFQPTYRIAQYDSSSGVRAGRYIRVDEGNRVSLNGSGSSGQIAVFSGDRIQGQTFTIKASDARLLEVTKDGPLSFKVKPKGAWVDVVTGVSLDEERLVVKKSFGFLLGAGREYEQPINLQQIEYVTGVSEQGGGLYFPRKRAYVLSPGEYDANPITIPIVDCTV
jgi:hypothetical protein